MTLAIRKNLRLAAMMKQAGSGPLLGGARSVLRRGLRRVLPEDLRRRLLLRRQARADSRSFEAGNSWFWSHSNAHRWPEIEDRIFVLAAQDNPQLLRDFVGKTLKHYSAVHCMALSLMARSGLVRAMLRDALLSADLSASGELSRRMRQSTAFCADVMAAVAFLLSEEERRGYEKLARACLPRDRAAFNRLLDAQAMVLSDAPLPETGTVDLAPSRRPAQHRLIFTDGLTDMRRLSLLFEGADKVTLIAPANLYGRSSAIEDLALHARPAEIIVAHARSRITRFSRQYHALHEETWRAAEEILTAMEELTGAALQEARPYATLQLADTLFFPALQFAAVEDYLQAPEFDQIIIASQEVKSTASLLRYFASVPGLTEDPRLEFVTLQDQAARRSALREQVSQAFAPPETELAAVEFPRLRRGASGAGFMAEMAADLQESIAQMRRFPATEAAGKPRILYISTAVAAYNSSSAAWLAMLDRHYTQLTGFVGKDLRAFFASASAGEMPAAARVQLLAEPEASHDLLSSMAQALLDQVRRRMIREGRSPHVVKVLEENAAMIEMKALLGSYRHWFMLRGWLQLMCDEGRPPQAVVISPFRPAFAAMAAAAARHFGIPSLALEPHGLNGAYCRYCKIPTDRYGVISGYFRQAAEKDFGVPAERVDVIGAPRLTLEPGRDPVAAQQAARLALAGKNPGLSFAPDRISVTFFSQPSHQAQMAEVWQSVVTACAALPGISLLLKLHPEEGSARADMFLSIAAAAGLSDRLHLISGGATEAIEASDLVLTCYSATATEAAIMGKPVFCIASGAENYPLNQNEVYGGPLYRDAPSLQAALAAFLEDPGPARRSVARFVAEEPQFVTGPEEPLIASVDKLLNSAGALRPAAELPERLVLEGPFEVFRI